MRTNTSPSAGSTIVDKLKVYEGGTGNVDAATARTALGVVASTDLNAANGIAGLDSNGQLSATQVPDDGAAPISLQGPTAAIINATISFVITNYDIFTNYTLSATLGTVTRDRSTIYYTAGATPGAGTITLNGRVLNLTVQGVQPVAPVLSVNDLGGSTTNVVLNGTTSAFAMNSTSVNTHLNTDWQIATDAAFTAIVVQSMADATNKIGWTGAGLNTSTTYYMRSRHRDNTNAVSDWSNVASITTRAVFYVQAEESRLTPTAPTANTPSFSQRVAIDGTGTRVAVSQNNTDSAQYKVFIYVRSGSTWTLEATLVDASQIQFGTKGLSFSSDGTRLLAGGYTMCNYYTRSGTTWTKQNPISQWTGYYLDDCAISPDGTRAAISAHVDTPPYDGSVRVYTVSGTTLTFEATMANPDPTATWVGNGLDFSTDATYLVSQAGNGGTSAYIFKRTGTSWVVQQTLTCGSGQGTGNPSNAAISGAGDRVVYLNKVTTAANGTQLQVWVRSVNTWSLEQTIETNMFGIAAFTINSAGDQIVQAGKVYTRSGSTWTLKTTLTASTSAGNTSSGFTGNYIKLSRDGTRCISSASSATSSSVTSAGAAYIHAS